MYTKISKLSMKSLTQTNSGKLITIVSGDIQAIERPLGLVASSLVVVLPACALAKHLLPTSWQSYLLIGFLANTPTIVVVGLASVFHCESVFRSCRPAEKVAESLGNSASVGGFVGVTL